MRYIARLEIAAVLVSTTMCTFTCRYMRRQHLALRGITHWWKFRLWLETILANVCCLNYNVFSMHIRKPLIKDSLLTKLCSAVILYERFEICQYKPDSKGLCLLREFQYTDKSSQCNLPNTILISALYRSCHSAYRLLFKQEFLLRELLLFFSNHK